MTTIDFRDVTSSYRKSGVALSKIYGSNNELLWELKLPPISQSTDKFLLINDLEVLNTYYHPSGQYATETTSIVGQVFCPHICNFNTPKNSSVGTTVCSTASINNSNYINIIGGYRQYSTKEVESWPPGFFQFVRFENINGIYLYAPEWKMIVSNDSPFDSWTYTLDIDNGFDISQYLSYDPFSDNDWTDVTLQYEYHDQVIESQEYTYKEFNSVIWPTTIIIPGRTPNIHYYFGYTDPTQSHTHRRYMLMPKSASDRIKWDKKPTFAGNYSHFLDRVYNTVNGTTTGYIAILPYRSLPWDYPT